MQGETTILEAPGTLKNTPVPDASKAQQKSSLLKIGGGAGVGGAAGAAAALLSLGAMRGKQEADETLTEIGPDDSGLAEEVKPPPEPEPNNPVAVVVVVQGQPQPPPPPEPPDIPVVVLVVLENDEEKTFAQAFAEARHEAGGGGGIFAHNGNVYNTFTAEEWANMTPEQHSAFAHHVSDCLNGAQPPDAPPFTVEPPALEEGNELPGAELPGEELHSNESPGAELPGDELPEEYFNNRDDQPEELSGEEHMTEAVSGMDADVQYDDYCNDAEEAIEAMS